MTTMERTPTTMRIWRYNSAEGGLEKHLQLHTSQPLPKPKSGEHLIKVHAVGLNPVDFKPAEAGIVGRLLVKKPATPGFDVSGRIVTPAAGSNLKPGQLVYGVSSTVPFAGGSLAEYVAAPADTILPLSSGVSPLLAGGAPVAAVTAYSSLVPYIHSGSRVFLNGGSGGVGTYAIQIAKIVGAHVTVSCSAQNAELCRSLGADHVIDYKAGPLLDQLRAAVSKAGRPFDHVVDNVFSDPALYFQAHTYTTASAPFIEVASGPNLLFLRFALSAMLWPSFLGGGRRKFVILADGVKRQPLEIVAGWISDGRIKPVTDQVFAMEDAVEAFKRLKTGRARGKVIVNVAAEEK